VYGEEISAGRRRQSSAGPQQAITSMPATLQPSFVAFTPFFFYWTSVVSSPAHLDFLTPQTHHTTPHHTTTPPHHITTPHHHEQK
jgi:hypothetical protein